MNKKDGKIVATTPITYSKYIWDTVGRIGYRALIKSHNGAFLSDLSFKDVSFVDSMYQTTKITTDISMYNSDFVKIHPTIDTEKYTLFSILSSYWIDPELKEKYFYFDKTEKNYSS